VSSGPDVSTLPTSPAPPPASTEAERRVFMKIGWRLMPVLIVSYVLNYLDRTNIAYAGPPMRDALGLTAQQFGFGAGVFFAGYCFLELPSNMALYRVGARVWISRIMISWGLASAATSLASGPTSFYLLRFLLGATEAGFFPGIAFYLTTWFPSEYRTRIIAWFMVAIPVSMVVGAPLSALILGMDGVGALAGWQWVFLVEGLPVVLVGVSILWLLPDRPEDAAWLTEEDRRIVRERLASERKPKEVRRLGPALADPRVWILAGVQFGFLVGSYGILIFFPQMLKDEFGVKDVEAALLAGPSYLCATIGMILWARHVERKGRKIVNLALACALSAAGFLGAVVSFSGNHFWMSVFWVTMAVVGVNGARGIFWTIPPRFLSGVAAAGGLAFINSIGTAGGFVGPNVMGWLEDRTGSYSAGLLALSGFLVMASLMAWSLKLLVDRQQDRTAAADL
jgi:MFS transporter, ACS family, tartrate transporter